MTDMIRFLACCLFVSLFNFIPMTHAASFSPFAVGFRQIEVPDAAHDMTFPVLPLYPTPATGQPTAPYALGPFSVNASPEAEPAPGSFPVVVISHGRTGTNLGYFPIAEHLAATGYIVALPLHHRDNYRNGSLAESDLTLELRPRHVTLTLDAVAADETLAACADADRAAIIGHSMGGYTALAVAGGRPYSQKGQPVNVSRDDRVKALVLLAPATFWYDYDAGLSGVTAAILLLTGESDNITPGAHHASLIRRSLPTTTPFTHEVVAGAGHYSFLAPFPEVMRRPDFPPANDPADFDRAAFQRELPRRIAEFLQSPPRSARDHDSVGSLDSTR